MIKVFILMLSALLFCGCSTQNEALKEENNTDGTKQEEINVTVPDAEVKIDDAIVGTWIINEHQTITFNGDGTGSVSDDGSGRLDNKADTYDMTYKFHENNKISMMFSMNFECSIGASAIYEISVADDELTLISRNTEGNITEKIVLTK